MGGKSLSGTMEYTIGFKKALPKHLQKNTNTPASGGNRWVSKKMRVKTAKGNTHNAPIHPMDPTFPGKQFQQQETYSKCSAKLSLEQERKAPIETKEGQSRRRSSKRRETDQSEINHTTGLRCETNRRAVQRLRMLKWSVSPVDLLASIVQKPASNFNGYASTQRHGYIPHTDRNEIVKILWCEVNHSMNQKWGEISN